MMMRRDAAGTPRGRRPKKRTATKTRERNKRKRTAKMQGTAQLRKPSNEEPHKAKRFFGQAKNRERTQGTRGNRRQAKKTPLPPLPGNKESTKNIQTHIRKTEIPHPTANTKRIADTPRNQHPPAACRFNGIPYRPAKDRRLPWFCPHCPVPHENTT